MNNLKAEILKLQDELEKKKKILFSARLEKISKCKFTDFNIKKVSIFTDIEKKQWEITYKHETNFYDLQNYYYESNNELSDSDLDRYSSDILDIDLHKGLNKDSSADLNKNINRNSNQSPKKENNKSSKKSKKKTKFKKSKIIFGKREHYFLEGGINMEIYRNGIGDLRIKNVEYDLEIDLDEQIELAENYSKNPNIPEWLALKTFLHMMKNKWDDEAMIYYLSVV